ncbi:MAG TPA: outer membrane beta-barrel protein [Vicinamibacterales bacterium]|jgi:hypothetical protein
MTRTIVAVAAIAASFVTREASAQGFFLSPFVGTTLTSPTPNGSASKPSFGVAFGNLGKIVGFDTEIAYFPELLDNNASDAARSKVLTFSGDMLIGPMIGPVKAYAAVGAGDLLLNVQSLGSVVASPVASASNPESLSSNYFTFNVGGGAIAFFNPHFGIRGDLRYFRAFGFDLPGLEATDQLTLSHFDFWRASVGLAMKF